MKTTLSAFKMLLKKGSQSPRNYAGVIAIWSKDDRAWSYTDGFKVIGSGKVGDGHPEHMITLKDVEYGSLENLHDPLVPHHAARRPSLKYPNVHTAIDRMPKQVKAKADLNIDLLIESLTAMKKLTGSNGYVTVELTEETVRLTKGNIWAIHCNANTDCEGEEA